jgi:F0F1-type ATP synthase assembly protein I
MAHPPRDPNDDRPPLIHAGEAMGVGLQFAGSIVMFLLVGRWLDGRLDTSPWFLLIGVFAGAGAGFYSIYRQLVIVPREREERKKGDKG